MELTKNWQNATAVGGGDDQRKLKYQRKLKKQKENSFKNYNMRVRCSPPGRARYFCGLEYKINWKITTNYEKIIK